MPPPRSQTDWHSADIPLNLGLPGEASRPRWSPTAFELALVFAFFFLQGATPAPDVNEPYYVGKAIHYWNPDWIPGDFFLETPDAHVVFCFLFGWLGRWLEPTAMVWVGRVLTWLLLAWAWCRASRAVVPKAWFSVFGAALFVVLQQHGQMAGEWMIGGVEAKGFAYVFVLLGLAAVLRDHWASACVFFGAAAAFHVLVGGWAAVACGLAWLFDGRKRVGLDVVWPGMLVGALAALPGVIPAIALDWGTDGAVCSQAHQIYVFQRLAHHLVPRSFARTGMLWFAGLVVVWMLLPGVTRNILQRFAGEDYVLDIEFPASSFPRKQLAVWRRLRAFVNGSLVILVAGLGLALLESVSPAWAAGWLRFYWFRLADVMLPLGVAFGLALALRTQVWRTWLLAVELKTVELAARSAPTTENLQVSELLYAHLEPHTLKVFTGWIICVLMFLWCTVHLGGRFLQLTVRRPPPAYRQSSRTQDFQAWRAACRWVATSGKVPRDACFLTPRMNQTFKWYARRAEVVNRKDVPQDAASLVEWWDRLRTIHATDQPAPFDAWYKCLEELGTERLRELGRRYGAAYVISRRRRQGRPPDLPVVYRNQSYAIYRLDGAPLER